MTRRNSSGLISQNGAKTEVNATFTQTSIGPNRSSACSAARSTASKSATSVGTASAVPPALCTASAAASRPSSPRAISTTFAPRRPKSSAVARPIPALAPVITTVSVTCLASCFPS